MNFHALNSCSILSTVFIFVVLLFLRTVHAQQLVPKPTATLTSGVYTGLTTTLPNSTVMVEKFLGLPFAIPPVGSLRFAPPEPVKASTTRRSSTSAPPTCIQNGRSPEIGEDESEDCLYLNIFKPLHRNGSADLPVMIWLYGGGLQYGGASQDLYDGSKLAGYQNVIIVVPNYRLNAFGFPGDHPYIPMRERNLGLLDQRQAFFWVKDNIAHFGGNANAVTVFGESAGARSADFHLLTMGENPPFRAVIMQSGSSELTPLADMQRAKASATGGPAFSQLARKVGCGNGTYLMSCMRSVSKSELKEAMVTSKLYFGTVFDNYTNVFDQAQTRRLHIAAFVPLLIGTNADEMRASVQPWRNKTLAEYIRATIPDDNALASRLLATYTPSKANGIQTSFDAISALATEMSFTCITSREAKISAANGYPTWRYLFNASFPNTEKGPGTGAVHASEIQFVFGNLPPNSAAEEAALSRTMMQAWADFARDPVRGLAFSKVNGEDETTRMAHFMADGSMSERTSKGVDDRCKVFESLYEGRA